MYAGGGFCHEVIESCTASADLDPASSSAELRSSAYRKAASGLGGNPGRSSNNDVHELLECPVCMNLMYPPIYQVCSRF
jgi:E3 ubiquitin-protein ligase SIAH1